MSSKKNNKNTNSASNNYRLVVLNEENYEERFALRLNLKHFVNQIEQKIQESFLEERLF